MDKYEAIIDMGSNSVRLVIYCKSDKGVMYEVDHVKNTIRLSAYLDKSSNISDEGMEKTISTLLKFRRLCEVRGVTKVIGVATAAVRKAGNKEFFLKEVSERTGFHFRLLTGEEEAYYGYLAVVNSIRVNDCLTIDVGGGSTEVVKICNRNLVKSHSFPFGAVTLTQQFFHHEVPTPEEIQSLENYLRSMFATQPWIKKENIPLVGMGGTARNLGKIHQKISRYPLPSLHQYEMKTWQIDSVYDYVRPLTIAQLKNVEGLSKERADIIVAGIAIIKVLLEHAECDSLMISNRGLRDGVWMENDLSPAAKPLLNDVVEHGVQMFINRYNVNPVHAAHVDQLTGWMFDQLKQEKVHNYGNREKMLLRVASRLRDIGQAINLRESNQHTFYLMIHVLLPGLSHRERLLAALLASYKGTKKMRQLAAPYDSLLTEADFQMIEQLSLLILMAKALDRTATQQVSIIRYTRSQEEITLRCFSNGNQVLEMDAIEEYKKKFKKQFGHPLQIEWKAL
ncbi:Ppx/GppA phosphatase family protein [Aneurinibacillus terranovensis]|uniref:Ppx/GppA phosphatase family protein n=1 Tax=Aneurinibacillus terranovensis TaxID=278991 RepID=UPI00041962D0|nr:Ppx/GppA phosphatase family protein [Aneurinibacillus terranovensis]